MSRAKTWAAVLGGLLLVLSGLGRQSTSPAPPPATDAVAAAVETRQSYRSAIGPSAREFAKRVEAGEFATEVDECKAWAAEAKRVARDSTKVTDAAFAAMYAATRELPEDKRRAARAAFYREFGDGMEK